MPRYGMPTAPAGVRVDETSPVCVESAHASITFSILCVTSRNPPSLVQVLHENQHQHNMVTLKVTRGLPPRNFSSYLYSHMHLPGFIPLGPLYLGFLSFPGLI